MKNHIVKEDLLNIISSNLPWHEFNGKTILISGANGFLPAYMVRILLLLKTRVIGIVRNKDRAQTKFTDILNNKSFKLIVQDVCKPVLIKENIDYIIHAASQASPKYYGIDPVGTLNANILGTNNLLNLAREKKVKGFLYFSSGEVYGEVNESKIPVKEDYYGFIDPLDVRSCYAQSKRMGENMCISWFQQYGIPVKIVRPFHTYGPGMKLDDGRVFADFVSDIVHNRDICLKSDGSAIRAFCYLADATEGFFTVLLKGKYGEAYNVGDDKGEIGIGDLANLLVNLFPEKNLNVVRKNIPDNNEYLKSKITRNCPDISKIKSLGWCPKTSIEEGFKRVIRSFL